MMSTSSRRLLHHTTRREQRYYAEPVCLDDGIDFNGSNGSSVALYNRRLLTEYLRSGVYTKP